MFLRIDSPAPTKCDPGQTIVLQQIKAFDFDSFDGHIKCKSGLDSSKTVLSHNN